MGCNVTGIWDSQLIGIVYDTKTKLPVEGALISSPCWVDSNTISDATGEFTFPVINEGEYDFVVTMSGYENKDLSDVLLVATKTKFIEIGLNPILLTIAGNVFIKSRKSGLAGGIATGVEISLQRKLGGIVDTQISNDGCFRFAEVLPGEYVVKAGYSIANNRYAASLDVVLSAGQSLFGLNLELSRI